jgi:antitoxin HigA-1
MSRLPTDRAPLHPGEILREEFIVPHDLTVTRAPELLHVDRVRLSEIVNGRRSITPDTALRLERLFGASADFWLNLQKDYDDWQALHSPAAE